MEIEAEKEQPRRLHVFFQNYSPFHLQFYDALKFDFVFFGHFVSASGL